MGCVDEILDSEDEGRDLSVSEDEAQAQPQRSPEVTNVRSTGSTDASFFQRVYDEQRRPGRMHDQIVDSQLPITGVPATTAGTEKNASSSITDPMPASLRAKGRREARDIAVLTQVTTPSRGVKGMEDVWEIQSSPEAPTTSSMGKCKQRQELIFEQEISSIYAHVEDEMSRRSNRKTSQLGKLPADLELIPQANNTEIPEDVSFEGMSGNVLSGETGSLDIVPSAFIPSQKCQDAAVNAGEVDRALHEQEIQSEFHVDGRSSATTIAYPTPSRFAPSGQARASREDEAPIKPLRKRKRPSFRDVVDELAYSDHDQDDKPARQTRRGRKTTTRDSPDNTTLDPERQEDVARDEPLVGLVSLLEKHDAVDGLIESITITQPQSTRPKKKRGRKKKDEKVGEKTLENERVAAGREISQNAVHTSDKQEPAGPTMRERGRPKKLTQPEALSCGSPDDSQDPGPETGYEKIWEDAEVPGEFRDAPAKEQAKLEKVGDLKFGIRIGEAKQAAKVRYRVGLSKRSRIAPLLKSLRK